MRHLLSEEISFLSDTSVPSVTLVLRQKHSTEKKNICENDIKPLIIYLFSMMTHVWEESNGPKLNYFQKDSHSVLLSKTAQNNMAFILWGALSRHYSKIVLQTEVYQRL